MASNWTIREADESTAEIEPPKKIAKAEEDITSPKDDTDGPTVKVATRDIKGVIKEMLVPYAAELTNASDVDETDSGQDYVDGDSFPKYNLKTTGAPFALIFNNFKGRKGSKADTHAMTTLFENSFKFNVLSSLSTITHKTTDMADLTAVGFRDAIKTLNSRENDHVWCNTGAVIVIVMTHGGRDGKLLFHGLDRSEYTSEVDIQTDLIEPFSRNPSLVGKPKVFILPSCRVARHHTGMEVDEQDGPGGTKTSPKNADVLVAYSTSEGQVAVRHEESGSWYVQAFVEVLTKYHKKQHLVELLTEVNRRVAEKTSCNDGYTKNMPEFVSKLSKRLYF